MKQSIALIYLLFISIHIFPQSSFNTETTTTTAITIINQYPDYPATPGDVYDIYLLTSVNESKQIAGFVDTNYDIDLSFIGKVNVKGQTYTKVQETIKKKLTNAYPGSIVSVVMRAPGKFKVTLLGEVKNAEIVDTMGLKTLAEVIKDKTTPYASLRDIEIKSEDGEIKKYDLYKFIRYADKSNNPFLRPNDIINLKQHKRRIRVEGQVRRPGIYELIDSDTLYDVLYEYGNGLTKNAELKEIEIKKFTNESNEYEDSTLYINGENDNLKSVKVTDGDIITIKNKLKYMSKVTIQGAISPEGQPSSSAGNNVSNKVIVPITSGSRISTVIKDMTGTFNLTSDLEKAMVLRNGSKQPVNIKSILEEVGHSDDIKLENNDIIIIPFRQLKVFVAGSVNRGGAVPFIENRTAMYYIGLAGGFNRTENFFRTYSIRNVYGEKVKKNSIISPEDVIWVNRDHPISYLQEYAGYLTAIVVSALAVKGIYDLTEAIKNMDGGAIDGLDSE